MFPLARAGEGRMKGALLFFPDDFSRDGEKKDFWNRKGG